MVVSKAPAPPPGLEDGQLKAKASNLWGYANGPCWTPMGGVPNALPDLAAQQMSLSQRQGLQGLQGLQGAQGGAQGGAPGYPVTRQAATAKAALQMFQAPGSEQRQRAEEAAKANARRLRNVWPKASIQPSQESGQRETMERIDMQAPQARYTGVLKVFKPESGYGFIDCQELKKTYGCDVFTNQGIEGGIVVGSVVSFVLELNNGKPQARDARLEADKSEDSGLRVGDVLGKVFKGRVKSFNVARGFGFITCNELSSLFGGRDVYVSLAQVPGGRPLIMGSEVEFTLSVNAQGQPQAKKLKEEELQQPLQQPLDPLDDLGELPTAQSVGDKLLKMG